MNAGWIVVICWFDSQWYSYYDRITVVCKKWSVIKS